MAPSPRAGRPSSPRRPHGPSRLHPRWRGDPDASFAARNALGSIPAARGDHGDEEIGRRLRGSIPAARGDLALLLRQAGNWAPSPLRGETLWKLPGRYVGPAPSPLRGETTTTPGTNDIVWAPSPLRGETSNISGQAVFLRAPSPLRGETAIASSMSDSGAGSIPAARGDPP